MLERSNGSRAKAGVIIMEHRGNVLDMSAIQDSTIIINITDLFLLHSTMNSRGASSQSASTPPPLRCTGQCGSLAFVHEIISETDHISSPPKNL